MLTHRRQTIALAGVLAATTVTGGALVAVLSSHPAQATTPIHSISVVPVQPVAPPAPVRRVADERGDS